MLFIHLEMTHLWKSNKDVFFTLKVLPFVIPTFPLPFNSAANPFIIMSLDESLTKPLDVSKRTNLQWISIDDNCSSAKKVINHLALLLCFRKQYRALDAVLSTHPHIEPLLIVDVEAIWKKKVYPLTFIMIVIAMSKEKSFLLSWWLKRSIFAWWCYELNNISLCHVDFRQ